MEERLEKYVYLYGLLLCLLMSACAAKKMNHQEADNLFEDMCRREVGRHGDVPFNADIMAYGNEFMDQYMERGRSPQLLWEQVIATENLCRGTFLYLLCQAHPEFIEKSLAQLDARMSDQDRIFMLSNLSTQARPQSAHVYFYYLNKNYHRQVRAAAANSIYYLPQKKYASQILNLLRQEKHSSVLSPLIMSLDLSIPSVQKALDILRQHPNPSVHSMLLTNLATSKLANKRELIAVYLDHEDPYVRATAASHLDMLKGKERLSWKATIDATPSAEKVKSVHQMDLLKAIFDNNRIKAEAWLAKGALADAPADRFLPFHESVIYNDEQMVRFFLKEANSQGDLLALTDSNGDNGLMVYIRRSDKFRAEKKNQSWEQVPKPLHAMQPFAQRLKLLTQLGLDINAQNHKGETALHLALLNDRYQYLEPLVEAGADRSVRDATGRTVYDWAAIYGEQELEELLRATR